MTAPLRPVTLADAEPLPRGPGIRTPQTRAALDERNVLIFAAAAKFWPGASSRAAARGLHGAMRRYAATAWCRERTLDHQPHRHEGRLTAFLWQILKRHDHVPSEATVRRALAAEKHLVVDIREPASGAKHLITQREGCEDG